MYSRDATNSATCLSLPPALEHSYPTNATLLVGANITRQQQRFWKSHLQRYSLFCAIYTLFLPNILSIKGWLAWSTKRTVATDISAFGQFPFAQTNRCNFIVVHQLWCDNNWYIYTHEENQTAGLHLFVNWPLARSSSHYEPNFHVFV